MKSFNTLNPGLVLFVFATWFSMGVFAEGGSDWTYDGEQGPEHWAEISPEFSACAGRNQSPIDLVAMKMIEAELEAIAFDYQEVPLEVINNGHTIQVNYAPGSRIVVDEIQFDLKQFHFHSPSENRIDGQAFPMEAHLVHADDDGNLAVVAVMFEVGEENAFISRIWANMPPKAGGKLTSASENINAGELLPDDRDYFRFNGSLTTPPCSEGVRWFVCKKAATVSSAQVEAFKHVLRHDNNRPLQPVNARPVLK